MASTIPSPDVGVTITSASRQAVSSASINMERARLAWMCSSAGIKHAALNALGKEEPGVWTDAEGRVVLRAYGRS